MFYTQNFFFFVIDWRDVKLSIILDQYGPKLNLRNFWLDSQCEIPQKTVHCFQDEIADLRYSPSHYAFISFGLELRIGVMLRGQTYSGWSLIPFLEFICSALHLERLCHWRTACIVPCLVIRSCLCAVWYQHGKGRLAVAQW
jgi:hypothetical protein